MQKVKGKRNEKLAEGLSQVFSPFFLSFFPLPTRIIKKERREKDERVGGVGAANFFSFFLLVNTSAGHISWLDALFSSFRLDFFITQIWWRPNKRIFFGTAAATAVATLTNVALSQVSLPGSSDVSSFWWGNHFSAENKSWPLRCQKIESTIADVQKNNNKKTRVRHYLQANMLA